MPDDQSFARGQDVNGNNQPVQLMRYSEWAGLGFCYGWIEYLIGTVRQPDTAEHRRLMREASYLTGAYAALSPGNAKFQAELFLSLAPQDDELPHMLDVEVTGLSQDDVSAWCDFHDAHSKQPLVIYTGLGSWPDIVPPEAAGRYKKYKLVMGQYPFDTFGVDDHGQPKKQPMDSLSIKKRSDPPIGRQPSLPQPWTLDDLLSWQHTGHGSLPGLSTSEDRPQFVDLHVARVTQVEFRRMFSGAALRTGETETTDTANTTTTPTALPLGPVPATISQVPIIAMGTKLGIGQVQNGPAIPFVRQAHDRGAPLAGAFGMDNGGVAIDARDKVPFRLTRIVQTTTDAPNFDLDLSDEALHNMAVKQIEKYLHLSADEKSAAMFILPWNEPRPHTVQGYLALTRLMFFTADICEANRFRFLAYAFNAGTPEWDETLAMWQTGINARLIQGGHGISVHLGILTSQDCPDRMDDSILGASIENPHTHEKSPKLANADPFVLRYRFLKAAADKLGVELAPIFATEFYPSKKPIRHCDPDDLVQRYAWLDDQVARDPYFRAVFPYAVGSGGVGMPDNDHAPIWPKLVDHAIRVKDRINASVDVVTSAKWWEALPSGVISPNQPLPTPTTLIPMRDSNGDPFQGVFRQNPMEARERRGNLFRVLDEPINDQMWWVMAEDLPAPRG